MSATIGEGLETIDQRPSKRARISKSVEDGHSASLAKENGARVSSRPVEIDEDEEDIEEVEELVETRKPSDLYLDTINRLTLDFDFEKLCSVSLTDIHVYGCLVCGKYFQGRGKSSFAYAHSVHEDHHVFINLETSKVYVLPDNYEVSDPSLADITRVLHPTFTNNDINRLRTKPLQQSYALSNQSYLPGYIGLNNIKHNDHMNVVVHLLAHVPPLRDLLLLMPFMPKTEPIPFNPAAKSVTKSGSVIQHAARPSELLTRFSTLLKKLWSPTLFKAQVSPHEFLQEVNRSSKGRFSLEQRGDPGEFLSWLLNSLHSSLGGLPKLKKDGTGNSKIFECFRGGLRIESQNVKAAAGDEFEEERSIRPRFGTTGKAVNSTPFMLLSLDLPPAPIFQDAVEKNIIPQVTIQSLLAKYDGQTTQEALGVVKRHKLTSLPPYIILSYKRFTKNQFVEEKNPTVVNFPLRGVDFKDYFDGPAREGTVYDLLSNVTHESTAGTTRDKISTVWKIHLRAGGGGVGGGSGEEEERWFQVQDLIVEPVQREMIFLGETVLQVWERRGTRAA